MAKGFCTPPPGNRRERKDITAKVQNGDLAKAIAEGDLGKYGISIGDYFDSPTEHTLVQETYNSSTPATPTTANVNVKFRYHLADLNTYYGGYGAYSVLNTKHIAIVVDTKVARQWHSGDASTIGYNGSKLQAFLKDNVLPFIKTDIATLTGDAWTSHLLSHQKLFTTALANWGWQTNQYISALTESEIYGHTEWTANQYQEGVAVKPLEIFQKFRWNEIYGNTWIWLRNMQAASVACSANASGDARGDSMVYTDRASGLILFY